MNDFEDKLKIEITEKSFNESHLARIALDSILALATAPRKAETKYQYYTSEYLKEELVRASETVEKGICKKMPDKNTILRFNISTPTVIGNYSGKCYIIMKVSILETIKDDCGNTIDIKIISEYEKTTKYTFGESINTRSFEKYANSKILAEGMKEFGATMTYLSRYCLLQTMSVYELSDDVEQYEDMDRKEKDDKMKKLAEEAKEKNSVTFKSNPPFGKPRVAS